MAKFSADNNRMYETTFHSALRSARKAAKLTLKQLQKRSGVEAWRLSRLERGSALPNLQERDRLARVLSTHSFDLRRAPTRPPRLYQKLRHRGLRYLKVEKPFYPPCDRESRIRFAAAMRRYPKEMGSLTALLQQRGDFQEVNSFSERVSLDSADECLFYTSLLAQGAKPAMHPPYALSPRLRHEVVCPDTREPVGFRPFPCLVTDEGLYFLQVGLATPRLYVVDFLRHHEGRWSVVEIDGDGHDSSYNIEKDAALAVPVLRLSEEQVIESAGRVLSFAGVRTERVQHGREAKKTSFAKAR